MGDGEYCITSNSSRVFLILIFYFLRRSEVERTLICYSHNTLSFSTKRFFPPILSCKTEHYSCLSLDRDWIQNRITRSSEMDFRLVFCLIGVILEHLCLYLPQLGLVVVCAGEAGNDARLGLGDGCWWSWEMGWV